MGTDALVMIAVGLVALALFVVRQRRARDPLYDLDIAGRRTFWVAGVAGIIVFGALMGAMFIGQQFLQEVLGYDTLAAGFSMLPAAVALIIVAPVLGEARRGQGLPIHVVARLSVLRAGLRRRPAALDRGRDLRAGGALVRARRHRRGPGRHARLALAHRVGAGAPGRHGVGHRRPPARPRRGDHAVDPRSAAHRRLRHPLRQADLGRRRSRRRSPTRSSRSSRSRSPAPSRWRRATRSTPTRSPPRPRSRSWPASGGPSPSASSPCSAVWPWCGSCSPATTTSSRCCGASPSRTPRPTAVPRPGAEPAAGLNATMGGGGPRPSCRAWCVRVTRAGQAVVSGRRVAAGAGGEGHRHVLDAADEVRAQELDARRRAACRGCARGSRGRSACSSMRARLAPRQKCVAAATERDVLVRVSASMSNRNGSSNTASSRLAEMCHITTLSPGLDLLAARSRCRRSRCGGSASTGVAQRRISSIARSSMPSRSSREARRTGRGSA